jgi:hypothetical protein
MAAFHVSLDSLAASEAAIRALGLLAAATKRTDLAYSITELEAVEAPFNLAHGAHFRCSGLSPALDILGQLHNHFEWLCVVGHEASVPAEVLTAFGADEVMDGSVPEGCLFAVAVWDSYVFAAAWKEGVGISSDELKPPEVRR